MQDNVDLALQNCVKLESIEKAAEELQQQAGVFKRNATELKKRMWWKNLKVNHCYIFIEYGYIYGLMKTDIDLVTVYFWTHHIIIVCYLNASIFLSVVFLFSIIMHICICVTLIFILLTDEADSRGHSAGDTGNHCWRDCFCSQTK